MDSIDASVPLAELVTERPSLALVLERHGLDFCCGGASSLAEACADAGLSVDAVMGDLLAAAPVAEPEAWASLEPVGLAAHLVDTHHRYLRATLPTLGTLVERVITAHGERHPELHEVGRLFGALRADLEPHLAKEEQVLFPMIVELYETTGAPTFHCGSLQNPIGVMSAEHDVAGELLAKLRRATGGYTLPDDACPSYEALFRGLAELEADTHLHVHKENNLLFPQVVAEEKRRASAR